MLHYLVVSIGQFVSVICFAFIPNIFPRVTVYRSATQYKRFTVQGGFSKYIILLHKNTPKWQVKQAKTYQGIN